MHLTLVFCKKASIASVARSSSNIFRIEGHEGFSTYTLSLSLPHPSRLRGPGSTPSIKLEPGLSLTAFAPPALAAPDPVDLVAKIRTDRGTSRQELVVSSSSPAVTPGGCCYLSAVCTVGWPGRALRSSSLWPGTLPLSLFFSVRQACLTEGIVCLFVIG